MVRSRIFRYSGVVPCIEVAQLLLPNITCAAPRTVGATSATAGHSAMIALPSSSVSVTPAPLPSRMPLVVRLPDSTMIRLLPILCICS